MDAVVVMVTVNDLEAATKNLREVVVHSAIFCRAV